MSEDILYSPIKRQSVGRVFENFTAAPTTGSTAPFADTPGPDAATTLKALPPKASPIESFARQEREARDRQQQMNEKIEAVMEAQRQYGYEQYQQAMQNLQQPSLQAQVGLNGTTCQQQFEHALQNPSFQQTVQPQYGLGYQNLYANTTAGTSSGLNQANLGSYHGNSGTAASNSLAAYNGIFSNTAAANTKCPITGRNKLTEAQAIQKIAAFL